MLTVVLVLVLGLYFVLAFFAGYKTGQWVLKRRAERFLESAANAMKEAVDYATKLQSMSEIGKIRQLWQDLNRRQREEKAVQETEDLIQDFLRKRKSPENLN